MPFGTLELLGIEPEKLELIIAEEPKDKPLFERTSVINRTTHETIPLSRKVTEAIEKRKKELLAAGISGQFGDRAALEIAARYDLMEAISRQNKDNPEHEQHQISKVFDTEFSQKEKTEAMIIALKKKCLGVDKVRANGVEVGILHMELLHKKLIEPKERAAEERGDQLEAHISALQHLKEGFIKDTAKKIIIPELLEVLERIPPLTIEITINDKVYKNASAVFALLNKHNIDLSLTQISEMLDVVKRREGRIGSEGAKLIKNQMKTFGEKVMMAADNQEKLIVLKNDFIKAFDVKEGGFGDNGLKKHLKKSWGSLEKYCRKILRILKGEEQEYRIAKAQKVNAMVGFMEIDHLLEMEIKAREVSEFKKLAEASRLGAEVEPDVRPDVVRIHAAVLPEGQQKSTLGPIFEAAKQHYIESQSSQVATKGITGLEKRLKPPPPNYSRAEAASREAALHQRAGQQVEPEKDKRRPDLGVIKEGFVKDQVRKLSKPPELEGPRPGSDDEPKKSRP